MSNTTDTPLTEEEKAELTTLVAECYPPTPVTTEDGGTMFIGEPRAYVLNRRTLTTYRLKAKRRAAPS